MKEQLKVQLSSLAVSAMAIAVPFAYAHLTADSELTQEINAGSHDRGVRQGWLVTVSVSLIVSGGVLLLYVIKSSKREEDDDSVI